MSHLIVSEASGDAVVRFRLYAREAPETVKGLKAALPFEARAVQARAAGQELWLPEVARLQRVPPEYTSIHLEPGEIGYAAPTPRNRIAGGLAILYGPATLADCINIFGCVLDEDRDALKALGERVWLEGARVLRFSLSD